MVDGTLDSVILSYDHQKSKKNRTESPSQMDSLDAGADCGYCPNRDECIQPV